MLKLLTLAILFSYADSFSQIELNGSLENYIGIYLENIPHGNSSDDYLPPSDSSLEIWGNIIEYVINNESAIRLVFFLAFLCPWHSLKF